MGSVVLSPGGCGQQHDGSHPIFDFGAAPACAATSSAAVTTMPNMAMMMATTTHGYDAFVGTPRSVVLSTALDF